MPRRYWQLLWRDKGLAWEALCFVLLARCFLWLIPFRKTVSLTARMAKTYPVQGPGDPARLTRLGHLVGRVSRFVPGATCLTQALALKWMLARRRVGSQLRIGVTKDTDGVFKAHAWLETQSQKVLIGGSRSPSMYQTLDFDLEKSR